ncbi:MAG TPA: FHA domain-containing protein [Polyangiaceae bacterium]|jgi:pSer/pThr/pTyr-binding forkhead associated (FHA) protein|nr:FHA domain-containing protein [Polyangiaceae bacterium]
MPITIIVRHGAGEDTRLTFDGTQRVVIGRGPGSDVRLPDASVSHRHATLRGQGSDFALVDEGSTNGTFVGAVRIAPRTSRLVRSGDMVRVGRVVLELRIDQSPVTRDVAAATRDLAFALVSQAMAAMGTDRTPKLRVVEGRDQGAVLALGREDHPYTIGRAPHCDLALQDPDTSREHLSVVARAGAVFLRDHSARNGTFVGDVRVADNSEVAWRPAIMVRIGRTVLALEEPVRLALADLERAEDEPVPPEEEIAVSALSAAAAAAPDAEVAAVNAPPVAATRPAPLASVLAAGSPAKERARWSVADLLVMAAALSVLALSLAGLVWLLRG